MITLHKPVGLTMLFMLLYLVQIPCAIGQHLSIEIRNKDTKAGLYHKQLKKFILPPVYDHIRQSRSICGGTGFSKDHVYMCTLKDSVIAVHLDSSGELLFWTNENKYHTNREPLSYCAATSFRNEKKGIFSCRQDTLLTSMVFDSICFANILYERFCYDCITPAYKNRNEYAVCFKGDSYQLINLWSGKASPEACLVYIPQLGSSIEQQLRVFETGQDRYEFDSTTTLGKLKNIPVLSPWEQNVVRTSSGCGLMEYTGVFTLQPDYDSVKPEASFYRVYKNGREGYFKIRAYSTGRMWITTGYEHVLIHPNNDSIESVSFFSEWLYAVKIKSKWYLRMDNHLFDSVAYDSIYTRSGHYYAMLNNQWALLRPNYPSPSTITLLNREWKKIADAPYCFCWDSIGTSTEPGLFIVRKNGRYGIINKYSQVMYEPKAKAIREPGNDKKKYTCKFRGSKKGVEQTAGLFECTEENLFGRPVKKYLFFNACLNRMEPAKEIGR